MSKAVEPGAVIAVVNTRPEKSARGSYRQIVTHSCCQFCEEIGRAGSDDDHVGPSSQLSVSG